MQVKVMRAGDFVVIALVLLLAAVLAIPYLTAPTNALYCEVRQDGALVRKIKLASGYQERFTVESNGVFNEIVISGRTVHIAASDCRDQVCVHTGTLSRAGQAAVCLPNRLVIKLLGAKTTGEVDAIVQ